MRRNTLGRMVIVASLLLGALVGTAAGAEATAKKVSAGGYVTCWIVGPGMQCTGYNSYFQLGTGSDPSNVNILTLVPGLQRVRQISVGGYNTCAVLRGGKAKCWGDNGNGETGTGTTDPVFSPKQVTGLKSGVKNISVGSGHSCAVLTSGRIKCWGSNTFGELGIGFAGGQRLKPVAVKGITDATSVSAGNANTCAVVDGAAKCWGRNDDGEVGDGTDTMRTKPKQVTGLKTRVSAVVTDADQSCAITRGKAKCWGYNLNGQVNGTASDDVLLPAQVPGLTSGVTSIATDLGTTCAVQDGAARCWGANDYAQMGIGSTDLLVHSPTQVSGLATGVQSISTGWNHTCALMKSGAGKCWGLNADGEAGIGSYDGPLVTPQTVPV